MPQSRTVGRLCVDTGRFKGRVRKFPSDLGDRLFNLLDIDVTA
jgi:hypothetical protein